MPWWSGLTEPPLGQAGQRNNPTELSRDYQPNFVMNYWRKKWHTD
jgi:hypothetical protein